MANANAIHHVVNDVFTNGDKTLCGRVVWGYDMPITLAHARACIERGTRLQPCKKCMKVANKEKG